MSRSATRVARALARPLARAPLGLALALLTVDFVDESVWFVPAGTAEQWRAELDLSYTQVGAVLAAAAPGALLLGTIATVAADRVSRRLLASSGAALFAATMVAFALGQSFAVLLAASFLAGAAATAMADACEVALVDVAGDGLRPALARSNLFGVGGDIAGPLLVVATTAAGWSWRAPFWVLAGVLAAYAVWLATLPLPAPARPPSRPGGGEGEGADDGRRGVRAVVRDRRVWALGVVSLLTSPLDEPYLGFVIAYLVAVRDLTPTAATVVATVAVAGGVVAYTVGTRVTHHRDDHEVATAGAALMVAGAAAIVAVPATAVVVAAGFTFGVGLNLCWLGVQHRMLTLRPGEAGATKALVSAVEMVGFAIPIAIGALSDAAGLRWGLAAYATLPAAALLLLLRVGRIGTHSVNQSFQRG